MDSIDAALDTIESLVAAGAVQPCDGRWIGPDELADAQGARRGPDAAAPSTGRADHGLRVPTPAPSPSRRRRAAASTASSTCCAPTASPAGSSTAATARAALDVEIRREGRARRHRQGRAPAPRPREGRASAPAATASPATSTRRSSPASSSPSPLPPAPPTAPPRRSGARPPMQLDPDRRLLERIFEEVRRTAAEPAGGIRLTCAKSRSASSSPRPASKRRSPRSKHHRRRRRTPASASSSPCGHHGRRLARDRRRLDVDSLRRRPCSAEPPTILFIHDSFPGAVRRARPLARRPGLAGRLRHRRRRAAPTRASASCATPPHRAPSPQHPSLRPADGPRRDQSPGLRPRRPCGPPRRLPPRRRSSPTPAGAPGCSPSRSFPRPRSSPTASGGTASPAPTWPGSPPTAIPPAAAPQRRRCTSSARNAPIAMDLAAADAAVCPTAFQAAQFPPVFREHLTVLHDGIDTDSSAPTPAAPAATPSAASSPRAPGSSPTRPAAWSRTAASRSSWRRCRTCSRADPKAVAVIAGENRVCYGGEASARTDWKARALAENDIDPRRVRFTGTPRPRRIPPPAAALRRARLSHGSLRALLVDARGDEPPAARWSSPTPSPVREFAGRERAALVERAAPAALAEAIVATSPGRPTERRAARAANRRGARLGSRRFRRLAVAPSRRWR